jgi:hypothetical protein
MPVFAGVNLEKIGISTKVSLSLGHLPWIHIPESIAVKMRIVADRRQNIKLSMAFGKGRSTPPLPLGFVDFENNNHIYTNNTDFGTWSQQGPATKKPTDHPHFQQQVTHTSSSKPNPNHKKSEAWRRRRQDVNYRGRGCTVETQSGGLAVLRAV